MRLVFLGSGAFGIPSIKALSQRHELVAIVTQPDRKAGRGGHLTPTPIAQWATDHTPDTPIFKPESINEPDSIRTLHGLNADAWIVIAYGQKLSNELLKIDASEPILAINLHGSILPRHRGAAPINAAILAGDKAVGNSVITVVEKMDAGDVLAQTSRPRDPAMTAGELHDLLSEDGPAALLEVLDRAQAGTLTRTAQDPALVTLARKMSKADGIIDWHRPADEIQRRIHAFNPWPGASTTYDGQPLKLLRAELTTPESQQSPGTLIDPGSGSVACGDGSAVRLLEVQPAGGRAMAFDAFARGRQMSAGVRFG